MALVHMAVMIWLVMYGNGLIHFMMIIKKILTYCVAGVSTILPASVVVRRGTATARATAGATASVLGASGLNFDL